jgi:hypothetical protein
MPVTAGWPLREVGRRVRLQVSVWDDGGDHHPPGFLAHPGDLLVVRRVHDGGFFDLSVAHPDRPPGEAFAVSLAEVELHAEQLELDLAVQPQPQPREGATP